MSERKLMGVPGGQLEDWLKDNLEKSKGNYVRWGRMVLRAIDVDDGLALIDIFVHKQNDLGSDINTQTTIRGYEGHIWSAWLHNHIGDTALHIALKQKRMLCVYALLLSNCDITIRNEAGETANDISMQLLNLPISVLQSEARVGLSPCIDPRSLNQLPDHMHMRNVEQEAWHLLDYGRCCYLELPQSAKHDLASSTSNPYALGLENDGKVKAKRKENVPVGQTLCDKVSDEHLKNSLLRQKEVKRELTSGEVAVGNVWGSNDITDVVRMLENQMNRRRRIDRANELRQSGLGLLAVLKTMDSAAVNATFATAKAAVTGGGGNSLMSESGDGMTVITGDGDGIPDQEQEQNHAYSEEPNYRDPTPFTVDRLPSHVRESKGSMAGIAKLKFLQLNQEKAAVANEFAAMALEAKERERNGGRVPLKTGAQMLAEAGMRAAEEPISPPAEGEAHAQAEDESKVVSDTESGAKIIAAAGSETALVTVTAEPGSPKSKSTKSKVASSKSAMSSKAPKGVSAAIDSATELGAMGSLGSTTAGDGAISDPNHTNTTVGIGGNADGTITVMKKSVSFGVVDEVTDVVVKGGTDTGTGVNENDANSKVVRDIRTPTPADLHKGTEIEARLRGRGKWYPATIVRCRRNGNYDIEYKDGEEESQVTIDNIKLVRVEEEEKEPEREPVVYDESNFIKVETDIPVVKSRNIFKGLLFSTAASVPVSQLKMVASMNSSKALYDDGYIVNGDQNNSDNPDVRMIDDGGGGNSRANTGRSLQSSGRKSQHSNDGNAPGTSTSRNNSRPLKGQIPGAIEGVTTDVLHANKLAGHNTDEYLGLVSVKEITHLSTFSNMKYMKVGDDGLIALTDVLNDDYLVRSMMLDHAHIASRGIAYFSKKLYTMSALTYLDLSQNAIDDVGAIDLAKGLEKCMFVSYSTYQRKCKADAELAVDTTVSSPGNSVINGGTVVGGVSVPSFNNDSGVADGSMDTQHSDYYANYSKRFPLTTLVLRANRITDVGVEALMKVVYKLNTVTNGLENADTNSLDLYVCSTTHKTPLAKYLGDKLTREAPPLSTWKSPTVNGFGLKRPEKKFYPRNPLKKVTPIESHAGNTAVSVVPALIPLSSDNVTPSDSCFVTNTSKIKAALMPNISTSQHNHKSSFSHTRRAAPAATHVVQFYLK